MVSSLWQLIHVITEFVIIQILHQFSQKHCCCCIGTILRASGTASRLHYSTDRKYSVHMTGLEGIIDAFSTNKDLEMRTPAITDAGRRLPDYAWYAASTSVAPCCPLPTKHSDSHYYRCCSSDKCASQRLAFAEYRHDYCRSHRRSSRHYRRVDRHLASNKKGSNRANQFPYQNVPQATKIPAGPHQNLLS